MMASLGEEPVLTSSAILYRPPSSLASAALLRVAIRGLRVLQEFHLRVGELLAHGDLQKLLGAQFHAPIVSAVALGVQALGASEVEAHAGDHGVDAGQDQALGGLG